MAIGAQNAETPDLADLPVEAGGDTAEIIIQSGRVGGGVASLQPP